MLPLEIWIDGSGTLADGPACIGVVLIDGSFLVHEGGEYLGKNVAELRAIRRGLAVAKRMYDPTRAMKVVSGSAERVSP